MALSNALLADGLPIASSLQKSAPFRTVDPMARLNIFGPEGQQESRLSPHTTLGRHPDNTIQLLDRIVSKEHCHVDLHDGRWILKDLGSLNGTFVNGERVSERMLFHGDEISLGSTRMVFQADQEARGSRTTGERNKAVSANPRFSPRSGRVNSEVMASTDRPGPRSGVRRPHRGGPAQHTIQGHDMSRVTIAGGIVESHIRSTLQPLLNQNFLPERLVQDSAAIRVDYEKLRVSYEVIRAIGVELDVDQLLGKILDCAFQLLEADRGVILLYGEEPAEGEERQLQPRCIRTKKPMSESQALVLSTTIINRVLQDKAAVLSNDASVDSRFQGAHSIIMQGIRSSMAVPLMHKGEVFGIMVLDSQIATNAFTEKDLQLFQNIANQAAIAVQNSLYAMKLEQEAITRERFRRLLSPAIAEQVISGKVEIRKGGELRDTTILFTDIRGFTAMSEQQRPQEVVDMLNEYFERMVEIVFRHDGTLDKFVGDEIMALFGAPVSRHDDAYRAVRTALEMLQELKSFNRERVALGQVEVHVGVGINSGEVVAGYLGSSRALEYTVIGDTVNTGARLCSVAKGGEVLISKATYDRVKDFFHTEQLPATSVKGKKLPLEIYRVTGMTGRLPTSTPAPIKLPT